MDIISKYENAKRIHPEKIVFLRLGDFYETFDLDAEIVANHLDLIITKFQGHKMAGFPAAKCDAYFDQMNLESVIY